MACIATFSYRLHQKDRNYRVAISYNEVLPFGWSWESYKKLSSS